MAFMIPFFTGLAGAFSSGAGVASSLGAAGSLIGTGTAAGIGAGLGMGVGTVASALAAPTALQLAGTFLSGVSAKAQGDAAARAAEYNAQAAEMEAASREQAQRAQSQRQLGTIRANIGKSGATMEGTPLLALAESAANAEIDALNTRFTGQRQAGLYRMQGDSARRQGNLMAGTSLLSGFGRIM